MKKLPLFIIIMLMFAGSINAQNTSGGGEANPDLKTNAIALKRFQDNRFGMLFTGAP